MHSSEYLNHFNLSYNIIANIFSIYSCSIDDVMDIRGESGFAKFLSADEFIKLLSQKPKRKAKLPEGWHDIIEKYRILWLVFVIYKNYLLVILFYRRQLKMDKKKVYLIGFALQGSWIL